MVRVEDLSDREIAEEEERSRLIELTKDFDEQIRIVATSTSFGISYGSDSSVFSVNFGRKIMVYDSKYFDTAMELAKVYEEALKGKEFTVKKMYRE